MWGKRNTGWLFKRKPKPGLCFGQSSSSQPGHPVSVRRLRVALEGLDGEAERKSVGPFWGVKILRTICYPPFSSCVVWLAQFGLAKETERKTNKWEGAFVASMHVCGSALGLLGNPQSTAEDFHVPQFRPLRIASESAKPPSARLWPARSKGKFRRRIEQWCVSQSVVQFLGSWFGAWQLPKKLRRQVLASFLAQGAVKTAVQLKFNEVRRVYGDDPTRFFFFFFFFYQGSPSLVFSGLCSMGYVPLCSTVWTFGFLVGF